MNKSVDYLKKNKTLISRIVKTIKKRSVVSKQSSEYPPRLFSDGTMVLGNFLCDIVNGVRAIQSDIVLKKDISGEYDVSIIGDWDIVPYTKDNCLFIGVEISNIRVRSSITKGSTYSYLVNSIVKDSAPSIDLDVQYDNPDFLYRVFTPDGQLILSQAYNEFEKNIDKVLLNYFGVGNISIVIDPKCFPKCDKRKNFIPILEIDIDKDKAYVYKTSYPSSKSDLMSEYTDYIFSEKGFESSMGNIISRYTYENKIGWTIKL